MSETVQVEKRFEGLPGVSLGGYVAGLAARGLGPSVVVTLTRPVAGGSVATARRSGSSGVLLIDGATVASAVAESFPSTAPEPITAAAAASASERYLGFIGHLCPNCFTCGPARQPDAGLRIFPGPTELGGYVACVWQPPPFVGQSDGSVAPAYLWAALDCPAIWGAVVHGGHGRDDRAVTGRLALQQSEAVSASDRHIVLGWPIERQGRKVFAGAAIYSLAGELLVECRQTMILTDAGIPLHPDAWMNPSDASEGRPALPPGRPPRPEAS